mgnify:CR=1 FL=1
MPLSKKPKPMQNCTVVMMRRSSLPLMVHLHVYPSPQSLLPAARALRQVCAVPRPCGRSRKKELCEATKHASHILDVEMSMGQMIDDVRLATECRLPVSFFGRTGGVIPTPAEVLAEIEKLAGGAE